MVFLGLMKAAIDWYRGPVVETRVDVPPPGPENDGSLCYLNVLIQSLKVLPSLKNNKELQEATPLKLQAQLGYNKNVAQNVQLVLERVLEHFKVERIKRKENNVLVVPTPVIPLYSGIEDKLKKATHIAPIIPVILSKPREAVSRTLTINNKTYALFSAIIHQSQAQNYYGVAQEGYSWYGYNDWVRENINYSQTSKELEKATTLFYHLVT